CGRRLENRETCGTAGLMSMDFDHRWLLTNRVNGPAQAKLGRGTLQSWDGCGRRAPSDFVSIASPLESVRRLQPVHVLWLRPRSPIASEVSSPVREPTRSFRLPLPAAREFSVPTRWTAAAPLPCHSVRRTSCRSPPSGSPLPRAGGAAPLPAPRAPDAPFH